MHPRLVPVAGGLPDPLDGRRVDPGVVFIADRGDRVEVGRDADLALRVSLAGHACPFWVAAFETHP